MIKITNKDQYLGVYKNNNPNSLFYHKLVDLVTYFPSSVEKWGVRNTLYDEGLVLACFYNCDESGIYISPRVLGVTVDHCHMPPYAIPFAVFLETHTKL